MLSKRVVQAWLIVTTIALSWLAMQVVHELGHVAFVLVSGGTLERVHFPLFGFSSTTLQSGPYAIVVVWAGAICGVVLPIVVDQAARLARWRHRFLVRFFAGFCLIANGAYLGVGWIIRAGDAGDLVRLGAPRWLLIAFGVVCVSAGLAYWNGLGAHFGLGAMKGRVDGGAAVWVSATLALVTTVMLLWGR